MGTMDDLEDKEFQMKVFSCNESDFPNLHDNIIRKQSSKISIQTAQNNFGEFAFSKLQQIKHKLIKHIKSFVFNPGSNHLFIIYI